MFNDIPRQTDVNATYIGIPDMESLHHSDYTNERVDMHYSISTNL